VLPGSYEASPPVEPKIAAIMVKTTLIQMNQKFRYFSAFFGFLLSIKWLEKDMFFFLQAFHFDKFCCTESYVSKFR
jgi:hypothetical protein